MTTNNVIIILINVFLFFIFTFYVFFRLQKIQKERDEVELKRFREFVIALKAKDATEYIDNIPDDTPLKQMEAKDELVELDSIDPGLLLKTLNEDYTNKN